MPRRRYGTGKNDPDHHSSFKNKEDRQLNQTTADRPKQIQQDLFSDSQENGTNRVVVPASLVHNWKNELLRFAPSLKVSLHIGNQRSRKISSFSDFDIIISSYHTVRQDIDLLSGFHFHYVILDESQVIKNPSSKLYKAMIMLNSDHRLALTGTPIENSLTDLAGHK